MCVRVCVCVLYMCVLFLFKLDANSVKFSNSIFSNSKILVLIWHGQIQHLKDFFV